MKEKQPSNPEELKLEIVAVSQENIQDLEQIRREVNGAIAPEKFTKELERYASGGKHAAFVLRDGSKVVGYIELDLETDYVPKGADKELCRGLKDYARLGRIGLLSAYRGKRIGNILLKHAEDWVREHGKDALWLDFLSENEKLVEFYESNGFITLTTFKDGDNNRQRRIAVKHFLKVSSIPLGTHH
jgi:ribosomal protein S18 acetylase RimI-like enzyme